VPDILEPPAPEIGVGTTTVYPLPPDLGGTIFDPPAPELGQGNETYPIDGLCQFVNFNSDNSLPKRILRGGLWGLMLISAWLGWRNDPGELAQDRPRFGLAQIQPAPEQPPIQRPPDPVQPDPQLSEGPPVPDATSQP
jgi:hypothetical protein